MKASSDNQTHSDASILEEDDIRVDAKKKILKGVSALCDHQSQKSVDFNGVFVIENFVTEGEETALCDAVYLTDFVNSQSGRRKQVIKIKMFIKKETTGKNYYNIK